jgi:hypothetical protein
MPKSAIHPDAVKSDVLAPDAPPYDRDALFHPDGPIDPACVEQAICLIIRNTPVDPGEPRSDTNRGMVCAMRALAALHPRDEIEIMLGVQALCAYHAATACWRLGANPRLSDGDKSRHVSKAATAVRTFDTVLRALERRQAKPLSVPVGRPAPQAWPPTDLDTLASEFRRRCDIGADPPERGPAGSMTPDAADSATMNDDDLLSAWASTLDSFTDENEGLDIANTEGIRPDGGIVVPEDPTPEQSAYIERRLMLRYLRERRDNQRNGIDTTTVFRPIRTGDLIR